MTALVQQQTPVILRAQQQQQQDHALKSSSNSNISSMNSSSSSSSGSGSRKNSGDVIYNSFSKRKREGRMSCHIWSRQDAWSYQQVMMAPSNTALPVTNAAVTAASVGPVEWSHPQYHPTGASSTSANPYYYYGNTTTYTYDDPRQHQQRPIPSRSSRPRTPSETSYHSSSAAGIQVQKSSSTPIRQQQQQQQQQQYNRQNRSSQLLKQQQQQHIRRERQQQQQSERPPSLSSTTSSMPSPAPSLDSGRRSSITSVSSGTFSIRSEMSVNTKLSLSKRLRKVFSMSHLRSKDNLGMIPSQSTGSNLSLATVHESGDSSAQQTTPRPSRRRSFASLFQKHQQDGIDTSTRRSVVVAAAATATATSAETTPNERPALRVDTTDAAIRRSVFKG
ncbi:hypothetical protein BX666DRAFT_1092741 [Dichotomocladium elegans]|nr:hypothetical protein BX666DRAFT_1092741 [Dichotomocladium elegans]